MKIWNLLIVLLLSFMVSEGCQKQEPQKVVAIVKYATHPALDEFEAGFVEDLNTAIKTDPGLKDITIEQYNAQGNQQQATQLAEIVTRQKVALIVAIATPAAQAISKNSSNIPLLYGAVADPVGAGIIPSPRASGIRNAGPQIIHTAIVFIRELFPSAKRIGTLYNPAEQNSVAVQQYMKTSCDALGLQLVQRTVTDPTQLSSRTESLASEADVIYSANDNTVNSGVAAVVAIAKAKKVPFVIGDLSTFAKGPVAAVGLEYRSMGKHLSEMARDVLKGKPISSMPPREAPAPEIWINSDVLAALGIAIPPSLATRVKIIKQQVPQ